MLNPDLDEEMALRLMEEFSVSLGHKKCECGARAVGSNRHSHYCPLTLKEPLTTKDIQAKGRSIRG